MTIYTVKRKNQTYLYVRCECGKSGRVNTQPLDKYLAALYHERLSFAIKRGMAAKRERDAANHHSNQTKEA